MMADEDETRYCSNCKRDIGAANFVMHDMHCHRNIVLCGRCDEPVPKTELDSHFEEVHAPVTCDLCGHTVEISELEAHKEDDCMKRMKQCCFCELDVTFDALPEHQEVCGSRTERCPQCNHYVKLKDQGRHEDSNCAYPASTSTNNHNSSHRTTVGDDLFMPFAMRDFRGYHDMGQMHDLSHNDPVGSAANANFYQRRINHFKHAPTNAEQSQANMRIRRVNETPVMSNGELQRIIQTPNDRQRDDLLVPVPNGGLQRDVSSALNPEIPQRSNGLADMPGSDDLTDLPCEFCGETYPANNLILHQGICRNSSTEISTLSREQLIPSYTDDLLQSLLSNNMVPSLSEYHCLQQFSDFEDNLSSLSSTRRLNRPSDVSYDLSPDISPDVSPDMSPDVSPDMSPDVSPDPEDLMLPCEFCEVLLPVDSLIQHQATCTAGGQDSPQPTTEGRSLQVADRIPQSPRPQPDPDVMDMHVHRRQETHSRRNSHKKNGSQQMNNVLDMDNDGEQNTQVAPRRRIQRPPQNNCDDVTPVAARWRNQKPPQTGDNVTQVAARWRNQKPPQTGDNVTQVAPRWRNQKPPQNSGNDTRHCSPKWRNQRPPNGDCGDVALGDSRWQWTKSRGKCSLPGAVRDVMPKLAPAARNPIANRPSKGNTRNNAGGARRSVRGAGGSQGGAERSQGGSLQSQGGAERIQREAERSQVGSLRSQVGAERSQRGSLRSQGVSLRSQGESLRSPGVSLRSPGVSLRSPGVSLRSQGESLRSPGVSLRSQGESLRSPGVSLRSQGESLRSPGVSLGSQGGSLRSQDGAERSQGGSLRSQGGAVAADEHLHDAIAEVAAAAVSMSSSVSSANDFEDDSLTFVKSVDDYETTEVKALPGRSSGDEDDEPNSILKEIDETPTYEASFMSDQSLRKTSLGRRVGGCLPNSQRPLKSETRESGAPSSGRGRNRSKRGGNTGSRR